MTRILSRHGNVIAADFRPQSVELDIQIGTQILFEDEMIIVMRCTASLNDQIMPAFTQHIIACRKTGAIRSL